MSCKRTSDGIVVQMFGGLQLKCINQKFLGKLGWSLLETLGLKRTEDFKTAL